MRMQIAGRRASFKDETKISEGAERIMQRQPLKVGVGEVGGALHKVSEEGGNTSALVGPVPAGDPSFTHTLHQNEIFPWRV